MRVRFKKIQNDHGRLRDDVIEGWATAVPEVGKPFLFTGPPRDIPFGMRRVNTSPVVSMTLKDNTYTVETQSGSTYEIELL